MYLDIKNIIFTVFYYYKNQTLSSVENHVTIVVAIKLNKVEEVGMFFCKIFSMIRSHRCVLYLEFKKFVAE